MRELTIAEISEETRRITSEYLEREAKKVAERRAEQRLPAVSLLDSILELGDDE